MTPAAITTGSTTTTSARDGGGRSPMALLGSGVPLSLLLDLALGPCSEDLLRHEEAPATPWWVPAA